MHKHFMHLWRKSCTYGIIFSHYLPNLESLTQKRQIVNFPCANPFCLCTWWTCALADPGGHTRWTPPWGIQFFRFDIQILRNVAASRVHAPYEVHVPPTGNPGSATDVSACLCECQDNTPQLPKVSIHLCLPCSAYMTGCPEGGPAVYTLTQCLPLSVEKTGVSPDVTLRFTTRSVNGPGFETHWEGSHEVQNRDNQWPTKFYKKQKIRCPTNSTKNYQCICLNDCFFEE